MANLGKLGIMGTQSPQRKLESGNQIEHFTPIPARTGRTMDGDRDTGLLFCSPDFPNAFEFPFDGAADAPEFLRNFFGTIAFQRPKGNMAERFIR